MTMNMVMVSGSQSVFFSLAKMGMLWLPWDPGVQLKVLPILSSSMGIGP